jgi:hypothetical protein
VHVHVGHAILDQLHELGELVSGCRHRRKALAIRPDGVRDC